MTEQTQSPAPGADLTLDAQASGPEPAASQDLLDPMYQVDGHHLQQMFAAALEWLELHAANINALNVFPVPDGDTGTNMLLTLRSATRQAAKQTSQNAAEMTRQLALGAINGARGNSGVILSQILNGFARANEGKKSYTCQDLAQGLRRACDSAYNAVMKPVEGTILTVIRAIADAAEEAAGQTTDVRAQMAYVTEAAHQALQRTPELLPILKEAGVVDSGGQGLVTIFEGLNRALRGEQNIPATPSAEVAQIEVHAVLDNPPAPLADGRYGYDIQFLIRGENLDVEAIRTQISSMGDCPLVVGTEELVKVHVHVLNPAEPLQYGVSLGMLDDIVVENMDLQFQAFAQQKGQHASATAIPTTAELTGVGIVAVAPGEGLAQHFEALGVSAVVRGGQSMNPSTEELLQAIQSTGAASVIVLPNNKNVILAAEQAAALAEVDVYVVPSRSVPQGMAAVMAFNYSEDGAANAEVMKDALHSVVTIETTRAARTTTINNLSVQQGDPIGLLDGNLVATGGSEAEVLETILADLDLDDYELVMLYYGEDASQSEANELVAGLTERYPALTFEIHPGGQPHYRYILSVE